MQVAADLAAEELSPMAAIPSGLTAAIALSIVRDDRSPSAIALETVRPSSQSLCVSTAPRPVSIQCSMLPCWRLNARVADTFENSPVSRSTRPTAAVSAGDGGRRWKSVSSAKWNRPDGSQASMP